MARTMTPAARRRQTIGPVEVVADDDSSDPVFDTGDKPTNEPVSTDGIAGERLRAFIERIERLNEEKQSLSADIKEVFAEAKGAGFETRIMRLLLKIRRMDKDDLDEQEAMLDTYKRAIGMPL